MQPLKIALAITALLTAGCQEDKEKETPTVVETVESSDQEKTGLEPREIDAPDLKRVEVLLLTREHIPDVSHGAPPLCWHIDLSYERVVSASWTYP